MPITNPQEKFMNLGSSRLPDKASSPRFCRLVGLQFGVYPDLSESLSVR
jgi:hypothetical protein